MVVHYSTWKANLRNVCSNGLELLCIRDKNFSDNSTLTMISFRRFICFLACFSLIQAYFLTKDSCQNQCTNNYYPDNSCQCNPECESHGNCCSDYESVCKTCENRCGQGLNNNYPCQCNQQCKDYKDCCPNYDAICNGGGEGRLTDSDMISQHVCTKNSNYWFGSILILIDIWLMIKKSI